MTLGLWVEFLGKVTCCHWWTFKHPCVCLFCQAQPSSGLILVGKELYWMLPILILLWLPQLLLLLLLLLWAGVYISPSWFQLFLLYVAAQQQ